MKITEQVIQFTIEHLKSSYGKLNNKQYSRNLHEVIDILKESNPIEWVAIGETLMKEGAYQTLAKEEGRKIEYDFNTNEN